METMQFGKTIVLAARQFQPARMGEHWLIKNGVLDENSITGDRVSTEQMSLISTSSLELIVLAEKITIAAKSIALDLELIETATRLVNATPDPEYTGVGLNFQWKIFQNEQDAKNFKRSLKPAIAIPPTLEKNGTTWGFVNHSPSVGGSILRVHVFPGFKDGDARNPPSQFIADFNFHFFIGEPEPRKDVLRAIGHLHNASDIAAQTASFFSVNT